MPADHQPLVISGNTVPEDALQSVQRYQADEEPSQNAAYLEAKVIACATPDPCDSETLHLPLIDEYQDREESDTSSSDRTI